MALGAWLAEKFARTKRLPAFNRVWKSRELDEVGKPLPPEIAEKEKARHGKLIEKLAPDTLNKG